MSSAFPKTTVPFTSLHQGRVSTPCPDLTYGLLHEKGKGFTESQNIVSRQLYPSYGMIGQGAKLSFPLLVVEMKGFGPSTDALFMAINQCVGGSAACVKIINDLNHLLDKYPGIDHVNNTAFSIAMSPRNAIIHATWSPDGSRYYIKELQSLDLTTSKGYLKLWRRVHNILDWGEKTRFQDIQSALDAIVVHDQKATSESTKGSSSPFGDARGKDPDMRK